MEYNVHFLLAFLLLFFFNTPTVIQVHGKTLPIVDSHGGINRGAKLQTYIVHVQKPQGTKLLTFEDQRNWYMSFLPNTTLDSGEPRMVYTYRHTISGFAAKLTEDEADAMKAKDGFLLIRPDEECKFRTTYTPEFLGLSEPGGLWFNTSITNYGEKQIIGMIDTGITFSHPSFNDKGMPPRPPRWENRCYCKNVCNNKVIGAIGFKDGKRVSPKDDDGHGTHTASIAAGIFVENANVLNNANGRASGTAPKAYLAIYKVGRESDALRGIDEAIDHHVNVISMSIGVLAPCPLHEDEFAIGALAAVIKGIVVVQAGGNNGPSPNQVDGAPWILTVGASTTDRRISAIVKLGDGREFSGESAYHPHKFSSKQSPLEWPYNVLQTTEAKYCEVDALKKVNIKGKIVLCQSAADEDVVTGKHIKKEGGVGVIFMSGYLEGYLTISDAHVLPATSVTYHDANEILDYFDATTSPTAAFIFKATVFGYRPSPTVASFSNRGPSLHNGYIIKPDVVAPGVNILGAWPEKVGHEDTQFNFLSGTSMAAPHVSGVVALLKNNHPIWSPAAIRSAIMTTAYTRDLDGNLIKDQFNYNQAGVFTIGSGHINPTAANDPGLIYDINPYDYIRYLCGSGMNLTDNQVSIIAQSPIICSQVQSIDAEQLNYPSISVTLGSNATKKTITRTVKNVGDANSEYLVDLNNPAGVDTDVDPKTLKFTQTNEEQKFTVTMSIQGVSSNKISEGQLIWYTSNGKYSVRSPIAVIFT